MREACQGFCILSGAYPYRVPLRQHHWLNHWCDWTQLVTFTSLMVRHEDESFSLQIMRQILPAVSSKPEHLRGSLTKSQHNSDTMERAWLAGTTWYLFNLFLWGLQRGSISPRAWECNSLLSWEPLVIGSVVPGPCFHPMLQVIVVQVDLCLGRKGITVFRHVNTL